MGTLQVFGLPPGQSMDPTAQEAFDISREYVFQEDVVDVVVQEDVVDQSKKSLSTGGSENSGPETKPVSRHQWLFIEFEKPVTCPEHSLVIGSRLDSDIHLNVCRIAFHGRLLLPVTEKNFKETLLPQLKIYKIKAKQGIVERMADEYSVIAHSLFKKETNIQNFVGMKVTLSTGEQGMIEGGFGQSGKVKIRIATGLSPDTVSKLSSGGKKKGGGKNKGTTSETPNEETNSSEQVAKPIKVTLEFKRYNYDPKKKMIQ